MPLKSFFSHQRSVVVFPFIFTSYYPIIPLFSEIVYFPDPDAKIKIPEKITGELDFGYRNRTADQSKKPKESK